VEIGKVPESVLKRAIFKQLNVKREEVLLGPNVGEDCSILKLEKDELFVVSSDPITAAVNEIGRLSIHITANDLASSGAEPIGVMLTMLLPKGFKETQLKSIMADIDKACGRLNIQVIGGHTEVTKAVNQPIISVTGIGKIKKDKLLEGKNVKPCQDIILTKWAGIEGTAIIASEKEIELKAYYNHEFVEGAKAFSEYLSVVEESKIAMAHGVTLMHDVTEGGVFGGLWEIAELGKIGINVDQSKIPIKQETVEICEYYNLNPYKLISSGAMLMIADNGSQLVKALIAKGIDATIIGETTKGKDRVVVGPETKRSLKPADQDEIYKVMV
jgi:hydrogenase maturation factor